MKTAVLTLAAVAVVLLSTRAATASDVKLIVQITVDGFRGDLISRYADSFGADGFRKLMDGGVWYTDAHHLHANTETIVGHATLSTGAHPSEHGMIGNAWLDRNSGELGYNIEDPDYALLAVPGFGGEGKQLDPTQAAAKSDGRSPANILVSTFADELSKSNNGRSKIFSVSGKDRSAVAMAGHIGKAFWMSTATGAFETSSYYFETYPDWVTSWNSARPADAAIGGTWSLVDPKDSYLLAANDDRSYETDLKGFGRTFPHQYGKPEDGLYYTQVLISPLGDQLTADFAKSTIVEEGLGDDNFTDYLSISFSAVDATNHFFGPSSLENEETVRRLDRTLAEFMSFTDNEIGSDHVLYVLSGDHGMPEMPEFMTEQGFIVYRNFNADLQEKINSAVDAEFDVEAAVKLFFRPYIYLDDDAIIAAQANRREVERFIVEMLNATPGIAMAMPTVPLPEQRGGFLEDPIRRNFHPQRSGDIYVVQSPYSFLMDKGPIAAMHGSPWRYDTHVPIIFAGPGIEPAKVGRRVGTIDVAVTLSNILGITAPSGASGIVLDEVTR